jgi:hypothetical protein
MTVTNDLDAVMLGNDVSARTIHTAVLDKAHLGDIHGALGSIAEDDLAPRTTLRARLKTLVAILGPGLIVMVGDNDAGAFSTYSQAGQNYGTTFTASVLFPDLDEKWITGTLGGGAVLAIVTTLGVNLKGSSGRDVTHQPAVHDLNADLNSWRMPPLDRLPPAQLSRLSRIWMIVLRGYLAVAAGLVLFRIFQLATVGA